MLYLARVMHKSLDSLGVWHVTVWGEAIEMHRELSMKLWTTIPHTSGANGFWEPIFNDDTGVTSRQGSGRYALNHTTNPNMDERALVSLVSEIWAAVNMLLQLKCPFDSSHTLLASTTNWMGTKPFGREERRILYPCLRQGLHQDVGKLTRSDGGPGYTGLFCTVGTLENGRDGVVELEEHRQFDVFDERAEQRVRLHIPCGTHGNTRYGTFQVMRWDAPHNGTSLGMNGVDLTDGFKQRGQLAQFKKRGDRELQDIVNLASHIYSSDTDTTHQRANVFTFRVKYEKYNNCPTVLHPVISPNFG